MINLEEHCTASDQILIDYTGPGYYSSRKVDETIKLEKVAEKYIDEDDVYNFCKFNGYKVEPYLVEDYDSIPVDWDKRNDIDAMEHLYDDY